LRDRRATTFVKRRRVDVESLVVELHDRPRKSALFVVALNKLQVPIRVPAEAHKLVPVVTSRTEEKESVVIDFRRDLIEVVPSIAVSAGPHVGPRLYLGEILA
jgi:acetolactate synthase small subunit